MADVPVPRTQLIASETPAARAVATDVEAHVPGMVRSLLERLWDAGFAGFIVGGSLRDVVLAREPHDWDLTTDALPEQIQALFPGAIYENAFGTVAVRADGTEYEITTFRSDHDYADFRRPHRVEFGASIEDDLARRDFTVNAMAWGAEANAGSRRLDPRLVDPFGGMADAGARLLRAVGDPDRRFQEDALRMIRAVRLAATLGFTIEPETRAAIGRHAGLATHLSGERIATEFERLLAAPKPSVGLRLLEEAGLLGVVARDLAAQRGIPQNKIAGEDLWDHTVRSVDAVAADRRLVRWAALVHDIGKPATLTPDGHFFDHEVVGAEVAAQWLTTLHQPRTFVERIRHLVAQHMFSYETHWSDTAVRRFMRRIGVQDLDDLFALREADNVGSGLPREAGRLQELRQRVDEQLRARVALRLRDLAVDGNDLISECGAAPGPRLGRVLDELLEAVLADSSLNRRETLLELACGKLATS